MKKLHIFCILSVLIVFTLILSVGSFAYYDGNPDKVIDQADLLSQTEVENLDVQIHDTMSRSDFDIIILTNYSINGGDAQDYADEFYDQGPYGVGKEKSGILIMLSMEKRDWVISTRGKAIDAITDYDLDIIEKELFSYFSGGNYYEGFSKFVQLCDDFFYEFQQTGVPYDTNKIYKDYTVDSVSTNNEEEGVAHNVTKYGILGAISCAISGCSVGSMKSKLKNVRKRTEASNYIVNDSFHLAHQEDCFLYNSVVRTPIPQETRSSGGGSGGGGSSIHVSSGGVTHGGRSGKF